jgi:general secretion pathway protein G
MRRRRRQSGLTLVELIVAFTIMLILTGMAVPLARAKVRIERERALRYALSDMRLAIDKYKDYCDMGVFGPVKQGTDCWPETLQMLVDGVKIGSSADDKKIKLLRRIPRDPFTGTTEWGMRSDQDDPKSLSWGGQCVFDVYSKTQDKAGDGTPYSEW